MKRNPRQGAKALAEWDKAHQAPAHTSFVGVCTFHEKRATALQQFPPATLPSPSFGWGLPLAAEKRLFHRPHTLLVGVAAFAVLKTRALYVMLCGK